MSSRLCNLCACVAIIENVKVDLTAITAAK